MLGYFTVPLTLSVPRDEKFFESEAREKLRASRIFRNFCFFTLPVYLVLLSYNYELKLLNGEDCSAGLSKKCYRRNSALQKVSLLVRSTSFYLFLKVTVAIFISGDCKHNNGFWF